MSFEPVTREEKIRRINAGSEEIVNVFIRVYKKQRVEHDLPPLTEIEIADLKKKMKEEYITDGMAKLDEYEQE